MADTKISALTAATTPLAGTEVLPIVQSGSTVKVPNNDLRPKQIQSNATSGVLQVVGPAAAATRVMTVPDANFTAARTDAAQTFTGNQTFNNETYGKKAFQLLGAGSDTAWAGVNFSADNGGSGAAERVWAWQLSASNLWDLWYFNGTSWVKQFTFDGAGNLVPNIASKGINFTANSAAAGKTSQLLNWYEEGTWTPGQGGGLTVVGTFSSSGKYTRIGRVVHVQGRLAATTSLAFAAGAADITNSLPFSASAEYPMLCFNGNYTASATALVSGTTVYSATSMAATSSVTFSGFYFV